MKAWLIAVPALLTLSALSSAAEVVPAWQEPGFVMEEVVVTATLARDVVPAWQQAGFVIEEVVATASTADIANAQRERAHRRARVQLARLAHEAQP